MNLNLIDEYQIYGSPCVAWNVLPLFEKHQPAELFLNSKAKTFSGGAVTLY